MSEESEKEVFARHRKEVNVTVLVIFGFGILMCIVGLLWEYDLMLAGGLFISFVTSPFAWCFGICGAEMDAEDELGRGMNCSIIPFWMFGLATAINFLSEIIQLL